MMHVVLVEPEIPPNTGNIARLCAATNTALHLIQPLGFEMTERRLRRAGMDYWREVRWRIWSGWAEFVEALPPGSRLWLVELGGGRLYTEARFGPQDWLVFGRETAGLPRALLEGHADAWIRIPMLNPQARSLNLANCVAVVLYEALRQQGFAGVGRSGLPVDT
jgi:tRNA (cytidine/uridine-2'-O-)-methyltransferase